MFFHYQKIFCSNAQSVGFLDIFEIKVFRIKDARINKKGDVRFEIRIGLRRAKMHLKMILKGFDALNLCCFVLAFDKDEKFL